MTKFKIQNWRIFTSKNGNDHALNWYDIKTKFKQLLRKIVYSSLVQELICYLIIGYLHLVYATCRKKFVNLEILLKHLASNEPLILACWHNRLILTPFLGNKARKIYPQSKFMGLASKHGDGRFIGKIIAKMGAKTIYGSTRQARKASRGINFKNLRELLENLSSGYCLGITPDGPRGPAQQINGELIHIAKLSQAKILAISVSSSKFKMVNSWDKMRVPLPFGRLCFYVDMQAISVAKEANDLEMQQMKNLLKIRLDEAQSQSQQRLTC